MMSECDKELGGSESVQVFAHAPEVFKDFIRFYFPLITETRGTVDMKLTEMCRVKAAEQNGCALRLGARFALAEQQGLTEEMTEAVPHYRESELFTPRQKVSIRFAEVLAGDHREASETLFDELRGHYTESEILDLGWRIVTFLGYGRLIHALDLEIGKACPVSRPPDAQLVEQLERAREWAHASRGASNVKPSAPAGTVGGPEGPPTF